MTWVIDGSKRSSIKGNWWLPGSPEDSLQGILSDIENEPTLELFGIFKELSAKKLSEELIILGETTAGAITLHDALEIGRTQSGNIRSSSFFAHDVFVGEHFLDSSILFNEIIANYSYLEEFIGIYPFNHITQKNSNVMSVEYRQPPTRRIEINEPAISLEIFPQISCGGDPEWTVKMQYRAAVVIKSADPRTFDDFHDYIVVLRNLLSLLSGKTSKVNKIYSIDGRKIIDIYRYKFRGNHEDEKDSWLPLFTLSDLGHRLDEVFNTWFKLSDSIEPTMLLLFSTINSNKHTVEAQFLNYFRAIEGYHGRKEKFLKDVINKTLDKLNPTSRSIMISEDASFIDKIVDTRNYLTHYNKKYEKTAMTDWNLVLAGFRLRIFIIILLLKDLGLDEDEIVSRLYRRPEYHRFLPQG